MAVVRPDLIGLPVFKMTGSGNDFVMVDGHVSSPDDWSTADIQAVCARGTGIGADGLVFVGPGSQAGAVRMVYFNSDGSRASMCGNAALCSTRLAAYLRFAPPSGMRLETDAGIYESRCAPDPHRAELRLAPVASLSEPRVRLGPGEQRCGLGVVGVPHLVVVVADVDRIDVDGRGRELRRHPALGPDGANVNFVSSGTGETPWRMRTYERGVEAETLACGTGAVAAACGIEQWGLGRLPMAILTRSGRVLEVDGRRSPEGCVEDVWLRGEGRMVFRGILT